MKNTKLKILIVSNPFGYGPTGQAIKLIAELKKIFIEKQIKFKIIFAGSKLCLEIIENLKGITLMEVDERNVTSLTKLINDIKDVSLCIGVQNRFIPSASIDLGIKCYFIDGLAWFWNPYPKKFLIADRILWTDFPNFNKKIDDRRVSIIGELSSKVARNITPRKEFFLLCLGGQENPLRKGLQENYLKLTHKVISDLSKIINKEIIVTLGKKACKYISELPNQNGMVKYKSLNHSDNLKLFSSCKKFISIGGQSSTFEALNSKVPIIYYLPSNLSQVEFIRKINITKMNWSNFMNINKSFYKLDEKKAIDEIEKYSKNLLCDEKKQQKIVDHIVQQINGNIDVETQKIYRGVKRDGYKDVYNFIKKDLL